MNSAHNIVRDDTDGVNYFSSVYPVDRGQTFTRSFAGCVTHTIFCAQKSILFLG